MLGIERPVLLAPMANIAGGRLAAAVSNAGGLGFVGGGYGDLEWINRELDEANGSFVGVGLITWSLPAGVLDAIAQRRPAAVWLSFGDACPLLAPINGAGLVSVCQVGSVDEARAVVASGANVLVAQGNSSGGHGWDGPVLEALVAGISEALPNVPLVAAGGINDQSDFEWFHELGAAGVALGTAFYATDEALDVDEAKQRLVTAHTDDTVRSTVYDVIRGPEWPAEFDGRSIRSELTDRWANDLVGLHDAIDEVRADYANAVENRDMDERVVWAGRGVGAIKEIVPAATIVSRFPAVR